MTNLKTILGASAEASRGGAGRSRLGRFVRWGLPLIVIVLGAAFFLLGGRSNNAEARFVTVPVAMGPLSVRVSASGALEPTRDVDVGSELSGTLELVLVRENDRVKKGQLLAKLDLSKLNDAVLKSKAAVLSAEASVAQMEATLAESTANLKRMRQVAALSGGKVPSQTELDAAEAAEKRARANLQSAQATVSQARATLKTDETNIRKATITSPVDGVVLSRKVEPGQTVAASMNTPVLFNIAEDLTQMELHVNVDEADVAQVREGQDATFTVSAWSNRKFPAKVERVDLGSTLTDNVVTYTTVLKVQNDDLALRPGMTASAEIVTAQRDSALLVPNAALRFTPQARNGGANGAAGGDSGFLSKLMPRMPRRPRQAHPENSAQAPGAARVWVLENGRPRPLAIEIGVSDGRNTEVLGGELKVGMAVITEQGIAP